MGATMRDKPDDFFVHCFHGVIMVGPKKFGSEPFG